VLVAVVRGANAPLILRTITEQLAHEHKVLEGGAERKEVCWLGALKHDISTLFATFFV